MFALVRLGVAGMLVTSLLTGFARADMGYIPPVNVHLQFENLDEFPQYDFYLKYGIADGNPYFGLRLMKVESSALFKLEGEGRRLTEEVLLLAVPRGQSVTPPTQVDKSTWLGLRPANGLQMEQLSWMSEANLTHHHQSTSIYRINIEGQQLKATWVGGHEPVPPWRKFWQTVGSGLLLSSIFVVLGMAWFVRRRFCPKRAKPESPQSSDSNEN